MILLPWVFLVLLESGPERMPRMETVLLAASVLINAYSTYLFLWTRYMTP
jgi:hypothetical protein